MGVIWYGKQEEVARFNATQRQLFAFSCQLSVWMICQDRIPGPNLADAVNALRQDKEMSEKMLRTCPLVVEGHDAWGTELTYSIDRTKRRVTITSAGPNRKYDDGQLDDIRVEAVLPSSE